MGLLVQSAHTLLQNTCPFPNQTSKGNMLIVMALAEAGGIPQFVCNDLLGNIYIPLPFRSTTGIQPISSQLFFCVSQATGPNTVQVVNNNGPNTAIAIHEFLSIIALDVATFAQGSGNAQSSGRLITNFPYEIIFGYEAGNSASGQNTVAGGAGWTVMETDPFHFLTQYQIGAVPGSFTSTTTTTTGKTGGVTWNAEIFGFYNPNAQVGELHPNNIAYPPALQPGGIGTPVTSPRQQLGPTSPNKPDVLFPMNEFTGRFRAACGHSFNNFEILRESINGVSSALIVCPICKFIVRIVTPYELIHDNVAFAQIVG